MNKITTTEAMVVAADHGHTVTRVTMINWIKRRGIGVKVGGRWFVDKVKLLEFLKGEKE